MFCSKCGNQLKDNSSFCSNCGNPVNNEINQFANYQPNNVPPVYNELTVQPSGEELANEQPAGKSKKGIIIAAIIVAVLVVGGILFYFLNESGLKMKDRTVMIYMTGSDLETDGKHATTDLKNITGANVNLDEVNVLVIIGGSTKWHNDYVSKDETSIYKLTANGFEKDKVISSTNMGNDTLLSDFLSYSYENYKAKKYDLILWNHGLGIPGTNYDEVSNDFLSIGEFKSALEKSPFNSDNKFEYVNLIACLEGNYEYALILSDYADYFIGSEEYSLASPLIKKLNYLTNVSPSDDAVTINKKLIDNYFKSLKSLEDVYELYGYVDTEAQNQIKSQTYSIIDLTKMKKLEQALEEFISDINLSVNYNTVAKARSQLVTYGGSSADIFSTVDLKNLVLGLKSLSPTKADAVLNILDGMIIYNKANNDYSNGLSIFFPTSTIEETVVTIAYRDQVYKDSKYQKFIEQYYNINVGDTNKMAFESDPSANISSIKANTEFGLYLTNDDLEVYTKANYRVFKKDSKGYIPVYTSSNTELNLATGYLKINYNNKGLKINDEIKSIYLDEIYRDSQIVTYSIPVKLYDDKDESIEAIVTYNIDLELNKGYISLVTPAIASASDVKVPGMGVIDLKDYKYIEFSNGIYKITDSEGKYKESWDLVEPVNIKLEIENFNIELVDLSDDDDYIAVVEVLDTHNNGHYTNIIKIEN